MTDTKKHIRNRTILGVETLWYEAATIPRPTIQPILDIISHDTELPYVYFSANTKEELNFTLSKLSNVGIVYLASHGKKGKFLLGNEYLTLDDLGYIFRNKLTSRAIHISSCDTMDIDLETIESFKKITKASLVSGYTKTVDWLEGAALDIIYLSYLQKYKNNLDRLVIDFNEVYKSVADYHGLVIYV